MVRVYAALLAGLVLVALVLAQADGALAGNHKVMVPTEKGATILWLIQLASKDGKWNGSVLDTAVDEFKGSLVQDVSVGKELFGFHIKGKGFEFRFEGKTPREKETRIPVSIMIGTRVGPAFLESTTLASFDPFEMNKEILAKQTGGHETVQAAMKLLELATEKKIKPEEVRAWADRASRSSEAYGPKWHREIVLDIAELLTQQEGFANTAVQYARKAEGMLEEAKDTPAHKKKILTVLATALEKAGKTDEAKEVQARNSKIAYITPKKFAGRKGKSDRVVLVELFTNAHAPGCVAPELAFDGLEQTYKPSEVVLLQYHMQLPRGPDALVNPDGVSRAKFYGNLRNPQAFFNGRNPDPRGGDFDVGQAKYDQFTETLGEQLEEKAKASITLSASRKGAKVDIKTDVADLAETGPDIRLRLALVEDKVVYTGANKMSPHQSVVRAFPGGTAGTVLKEKTVSKTFSVDLDEVRKKLTEYLDKYAQDEPFPTKERPMELKKLRVVAFVQNDETGEVLQAAQVDVTGGE